MTNQDKPKTLGETLPKDRPRWEAMCSSTESLGLGSWEDQPAAPVFDSQDSFSLETMRNTGSLDSLVGHIDRLNMKRKSSLMETSPDELQRGRSSLMDTSEVGSTNTTAISGTGWQPNVTAQEFVPSTRAEASPEAPLVKRRITKKRKARTAAVIALCDGASTFALVPPTPGSAPAGKKAKSSMELDEPAAAGDADNEDGDPISEEEKLRRWVVKRTTCVTTIKDTAEYKKFTELRIQGRVEDFVKEHGMEAPATPDAQDSKISKRAWEALTQKWRSSLRDLADKEEASGPLAAD